MRCMCGQLLLRQTWAGSRRESENITHGHEGYRTDLAQNMGAKEAKRATHLPKEHFPDVCHGADYSTPILRL